MNHTDVDIYAKQMHTSLSSALPDIVQWLIGDHPSLANPTTPFKMISVYSPTSTNKHSVPSDPYSFDSLDPDNEWRSGMLTTGAFIILECKDVDYTWQIGIEMQSASTIRFQAAPKCGFIPSAHYDDMINDSNWDSIKARIDYFDFTCLTGITYFSCQSLVDGSGFHLLQTQGTSMKFTSTHKLLGAAAADTTPLVQYQDEASVYTGSSSYGLSGYIGWKKLSSIDESTVLSIQGDDNYTHTNSIDELYKDLDGKYVEKEINMFCSTSGHKSYLGTLNNILIKPRNGLSVGVSQTDDKQQLLLTTSSSYSGVALAWNGDTY